MKSNFSNLKNLRSMRRLGALLFAFGLAGCTQVRADIAPPKPTLTLDFENGVDGVGADGQTIKATVEGKAILEDGKFGKAFKSGEESGYLHFPTKGIVSTQAGTVEMWVMPIDWSGDEQKFHTFFRARGNGDLHFYKFYRSSLGLVFLTNAGDGALNNFASKNIDSWKPGEWHHIAITWSPLLKVIYVDGKRIAAGVPDLPKSLNNDFRLGDHPFEVKAEPRTSQSLVDNIRIYDRVLSPEVIEAHFEGDYKKTTPLNDESAKLDFTVEENRLKPNIILTGADVNTRTARADIAIMQGDKVIEQQKNLPFDGIIATADFPTDIAAGEYTLRAALHDPDGTSVGTLEQPMTVPSRAWMNNTIGEEKKVLAPWTPLEVKPNATGFSVFCWGREYRFGDGLLPMQIVAKGESLLQSPMSLQVVNGGAPLQWKMARARVKDASGYEVNVVGSATAATPQGNVTVETNIHLEYDGLMVVTLKFQAPPAFKPNMVRLDMPVREQNAIYRHGWDARNKPFSGSLPEGTGVIQHEAFIPAAWLGDNERGLFWFCESAQFWPNWKDENAFEMRRENGAVTMRLNLVNNQALPENGNFQFGLQATPVKPLPANWRNMRTAPTQTANIDIYWPTRAPNSMKFYGYAGARDPQLFQERVDKSHANGIKAVPYSALNALSGAAPEWKWFGKDWDVKAGDYGSSDVVAVGAPFHYTSPTQESWRDFVIWNNKRFMEKYGLDGFYHDLTYPWAWAVPSANTGWFDGKEWQKTYPMLAYRELYRRNYAMVKGIKPDAFLMGHMSSRVNIPVLAYEDAYLNGETFRTRLIGKDSYMDVMSLDEWRVEYTGRQWGVVPFILPEFDPAHYKVAQPTRGLAALVMLHDTNVWSAFSAHSVWNQMRKELDAFGFVQSTFIPYWDKTPPATTEMKDVYVSVYKRDDGRALAIVGNTSKEARTGTITLNAKRLGLDTAPVVSWPDKKAVKRNGDTIDVSVPGLDYRMLLIGKAP